MSSVLGTRGLFILEAIIGVILFFAMIWRRQRKAPVVSEMRESFEPVLPISVAGVEIDPRSDLPPEEETSENKEEIIK